MKLVTIFFLACFLKSDIEAIKNGEIYAILKEEFQKYFNQSKTQRNHQGLRVRGSWRPNRTEIFCPQSYGCQRCVFLVLHGCSTGALALLTTSREPPTPTILLVLNSTRLSVLSPVCALACLQLSSIRRPYITFKLPRSNIDMPQRLRNLFRFPATGMCHFLPVHHLEWHFGPGQKVKI